MLFGHYFAKSKKFAHILLIFLNFSAERKHRLSQDFLIAQNYLSYQYILKVEYFYPK